MVDFHGILWDLPSGQLTMENHHFQWVNPPFRLGHFQLCKMKPEGIISIYYFIYHPDGIQLYLPSSGYYEMNDFIYIYIMDDLIRPDQIPVPRFARTAWTPWTRPTATATLATPRRGSLRSSSGPSGRSWRGRRSPSRRPFKGVGPGDGGGGNLPGLDLRDKDVTLELLSYFED